MKRSFLFALAVLKFVLAYYCATKIGGTPGYLLAGLFALVGFFSLVSGFVMEFGDKMYVIGKDGYSAKLGTYNLCLIDHAGHRIWIRLDSGIAIAQTVHETYRIEKGRTWCELYNQSLTFAEKDGDIFVEWGKGLKVYN